MGDHLEYARYRIAAGSIQLPAGIRDSKSGTPVVTEGIALVAGSKNPEAGKKFYRICHEQRKLVLGRPEILSNSLSQRHFRV
jgi:hypothetical protein